MLVQVSEVLVQIVENICTRIFDTGLEILFCISLF